MSNQTSFDHYARDYDGAVQAAIGASGETVAFFADLKARLARDVAPQMTTRILDFGCGIGNLVRALAEHFPQARVTGIDDSEESLAIARERQSDGRVGYVTSSNAGLPVESASYDLVTAANVFHHIAPRLQPQWLGELARVLRPGGRLVVFEHNPLNPLTRRVVRNVAFDRDAILLSKGAMAQLVREAGLRLAATRYYFYFPRSLAVLRPLERALGWLPLGAQYFVAAER